MNTNKNELFKRIGKEIEEREETVYWVKGDGLGDHIKKDILEKGISAWLDELYDCEYNLEHIWEEERRVRLEVLEEYSEEICEVFDIPEDSFNPVDYLDGVEYYYPNVYIDTKDVFNGETLRMRLVLYSDHDCQLSHWAESGSGYSYEDSYFGDMVDALNLCPRRMKRALKDRDIKVQGRWPVKKSRHGEELVDYDTFIQDIEHNVCPSNLTFPVLVDLYELWQNTDYEETTIKQVIIPKGANCGMFSDFQGGGSLIDTPLLRDVTINLEESDWSLVPDDSGYSIKSVYGVFDSFYTEISILNE